MYPSVEDALQGAGGPLQMLRSNAAVHYPFWYPPEWTSWANEQLGWRDEAVLFDQSHHMTDVCFEGPDVKRLLSDTGISSPATSGRNRAKQFVACGYDGRYIGDAILFGLDEHRYSLVGSPGAANWVEFQAQQGGYDVEVTRDEATIFNRTGRRRMWRYQLNGPRTQDIIERAAGGPIGEAARDHQRAAARNRGRALQSHNAAHHRQAPHDVPRPVCNRGKRPTHGHHEMGPYRTKLGASDSRPRPRSQ